MNGEPTGRELRGNEAQVGSRGFAPILLVIFVPPLISSTMIYTLWLFNIAMENGLFIDGLPIKSGDFPWLCDK